MIDLHKCCYCNLLLKHVRILNNDLSLYENETSKKYATLLEMKSYYWFIERFCNEYLSDCKCQYLSDLNREMSNLSILLEQNNLKLDINNAKCDVCRVLSSELFALLDNVSKLSEDSLNKSVFIELQYHVFISFLFDELIRACGGCCCFADYIAAIEYAANFIENKDLKKLKESVYNWKIATNSDNILMHNKTLNTGSLINGIRIDKNDDFKVYFDFNVYNQYEKSYEIQEKINKIINKKGISVLCSVVHMEEILRMGNIEYEKVRKCNIQKITNSRILLLSEDKFIVFEINNYDDIMKNIERFKELNWLSEERECINAEPREYMFLEEEPEIKSSEIGNSTLREIINNTDIKTDLRINPCLPDEKLLDNILKYVGIDCKGIREYEDMFEDKVYSFSQVRAAVVSLSRMMNIIGLHGDKITNKTDLNAVYPIYDKNSYRTIRSGCYDNEHISIAPACDCFVTADKKLYKKTTEIYSFLGIKTKVVFLKDLLKKGDFD